MIFYLKRIGNAFILPPGILIPLALYSGIYLLRKGYRKAGAINILLSIALYVLSITPVADSLLQGLEGDLKIPHDLKGDVIVVLGGGIRDGAPDMTGRGAPDEDVLARIVTAARLQRRLNLPVTVSGGSVFSEESEAAIVRRFLVDLGVPQRRIILESSSMDTHENALYTKAICERMGFKRPILITSATHMKRAVMSFEQVGLEVIPYPSHFKVWKGKRYTWIDYLPSAGALEDLSEALHEYLGLLFYRIAY